MVSPSLSSLHTTLPSSSLSPSPVSTLLRPVPFSHLLFLLGMPSCTHILTAHLLHALGLHLAPDKHVCLLLLTMCLPGMAGSLEGGQHVCCGNNSFSFYKNMGQGQTGQNRTEEKERQEDSGGQFHFAAALLLLHFRLGSEHEHSRQFSGTVTLQLLCLISLSFPSHSFAAWAWRDFLPTCPLHFSPLLAYLQHTCVPYPTSHLFSLCLSSSLYFLLLFLVDS